MFKIELDKTLNKCYNEYDFVILPIKSYLKDGVFPFESSISTHFKKAIPNLPLMATIAKMATYKKPFRLDYDARLSIATINGVSFYFISCYDNTRNDSLYSPAIRDGILSATLHNGAKYRLEKNYVPKIAIMPFSIMSKNGVVPYYKQQTISHASQVQMRYVVIGEYSIPDIYMFFPDRAKCSEEYLTYVKGLVNR